MTAKELTANVPDFIFMSNYINHHQIPFCNRMYEILGEKFAFIQTEPMEEERKQMGWQEESLPYVQCYYEKPEMCRYWLDNAKIVLVGGVEDESYIAPRLEADKPVMRCSERLYRTGQWKAVSPRGLRKKYMDHTRYRKKPIYMLCNGAYVPSDFHMVRAYPDKLLRWGYFPETKHYDVDKLMANKEPGDILWAARLIGLKHPELALKSAKYLKDKGYSFHMNIVGGGELEPQVRALVEEYDLSSRVSLLGYRTPEQVRELMEKADIFLQSSDRNEGWGAVINESMNSGCAVVVDHMVGAAPFLIRHKENGLIYRDGSEKELFEAMELLVADRSFCHKLGRAAYETITEEWNSEVAGVRLLALCVQLGFLPEKEIREKVESLDKGLWETCQKPFSGPCSPAPVISERRMYGMLTKERNK